MSSPLVIFLLLIVGAAAFFLGRWQGMSQHSKALSDELKAKDDELSTLKAEVNNHFDETARLFSNVTEEYKALYQHLAVSSSKLSNRKFDLKLSSNTSGLPGLGSSIGKEFDDSVIDSEAREISDYDSGPQQPRDYAADDMDDDYHPSHDVKANEDDSPETDKDAQPGNSEQESASEKNNDDAKKSQKEKTSH
ncbi:ZapG family protein [Kangiella sp.]|uniref:ZapG family protein n=1 Tax=Kangiella sp. TaxID=1920245 RepID=UPI003A8E938B